VHDLEHALGPAVLVEPGADERYAWLRVERYAWLRVEG